MLDPEGDLQELPSSDDDDIDASELRGKIRKITARGAGIASPEFTSPLGSPRDESVLSAKGRFLELKRLMQDDRSSRSSKSKRKQKRAASAPSASGTIEAETGEFEEIDDDWVREGSISPASVGSYHDDVDQLLESFRSERAGERDISMISHRMEHHPKLLEELRDRDSTILTLESKVMELDRQVIDLQDTLSEKEKLLNSKNDAVNCMVNQYQQSIADRDSELSKTQEMLFELEKKFGGAQDQWKSEKDRLNCELRQQTLRLKDLEDTNKLLESARLEQTTRDLELEDKLNILKDDRNRLTQENVILQSSLDLTTNEKSELERTLQRKTEEYETIIGELKTSLQTSGDTTAKEEYEAKMIKMKKQFQAKLKSLKENSTATENQSKTLQTQVNDLMEQVKAKSTEIDNHLATISSLEEKIAQESQKDELVNLHEQNIALQKQLKEIENQMIESSNFQQDESEMTDMLLKISTLENKIAELEEEKGSLILVQEELSQLKSEKESAEKDFNQRLGEYEKNFERTILDYDQRIEEFEKKTGDLQASLEKSNEQMTKLKRQFQAKLKQLKEEKKSTTTDSDVNDVTAKCAALELKVAELEEEKGNNLWIQEELSQLKQEKEILEQEFEQKSKDYEKRIEALIDSLEKSSEQISQLEKAEQSQSFKEQASDPPMSQTRITALEHQVAELEEEKGSGFLLEEEICKMKSERELLQQNVQEQSQEYEKKIEELNAALTKSTEQMTKMKRQFQVKLKALRDAGGSGAGSPSPSPEAEAQWQSKITELENRIAELEEEKGNLLLQMVDFDEQQAAHQGVQDSTGLQLQEQAIKLEMSLLEKEEELRQVHSQLNEMTIALSQKNVEVEQLMKTCCEMQQSLQQNIDDLSSSVTNKEEEVRRVIQEFEEGSRLASDRISQLEQQSLEKNNLLRDKDTEIQNLVEKVQENDTRFTEMNSLLQQYQGMIDGVRNEDQEELLTLKQELENIRQKASLAEMSYEGVKNEYKEEMDLRTEAITNLQQELNRLQIELSTSNTANEEVQKKYNELQQRIDSSQQEFRRKEAEFINQIEILTAQLASYEIEIEDLKKSAAENMQVVDLNQSQPNAEDKLRVEELIQELQGRNEEIELLNWKLNSAENERLDITVKLQHIKEENNLIQTKLQELQPLNESLQNEIQSYRDQYSSYEQNYNQLYQELGQKSYELQQLQGAEQETRAIRDNLQAQINESSQLVEEFRNKINTLESDKSTLQLQLDQGVHDSESLKSKLTLLTNEYIELRESLENKDSEAQRLRQDASTLQTDYSQQNNELKLKISSLMDQFNDYEKEMSVMNQRLKESDEIGLITKTQLEEVTKSLEEKGRHLEEKSRAQEIAENSLFEKTEELLKLEERIREQDEKHRTQIEQNFAKYSGDLDAAYDQLSLTAGEIVSTQEKLRKRESELEDMGPQLIKMREENMRAEREINEYRDRVSYLEQQLTLAAKQFEEVVANVGVDQAELGRQVGEKQMKIKELEVELEELRNIQGQGQNQLQSLFQNQSQNYPNSEQDTAQLFPVPVEPADNSGSAELQWRDQRIYDLEVQLQEMQINADDSTAQLQDIQELKNSMEILMCKLNEMELENNKLKEEINRLQLLQYERVQMQNVPLGQPQQPQLDLVTQSTASVTSPLVEEGQLQGQGQAVPQDQYEAALKEIKELKVKNGKMIQRFKQLSTKFDLVVKENEALKTKKSFSLDSAFEDEFNTQVKAKDALLEEKGKLLTKLQADNQKMTEKLDLLERGTERLTEMKDEQDRSVQELLNHKRSLETEVSALKWKVEELENISLTRNTSTLQEGEEGQGQGFFNINPGDQAIEENLSLRNQNYFMNQELLSLRGEIDSQKKQFDELNERNQMLEEEIEKLQELQIEQHQGQGQRSTQEVNFGSGGPSGDIPPRSEGQSVDSAVYMDPESPQSGAIPSSTSTLTSGQGQGQPADLNNRIDTLHKQLLSEEEEKSLLERKIELLQSKISEIEISEIKCFEESLMLKSWTRQLELDNFKVQRELERIYNSIQDGDTSGLKVKVLQDEVLRLVDTLHDRDKRCEQLTLEITRLLEERDTLQLKLSNVLRHNVSLHEEVNKGRELPILSSGEIPSYDKEAFRQKLAELEQMNYSMGIDLRREREARRLVQEQLFFSSSSRMYSGGGGNRQSQSPRRSTTPVAQVAPPSPVSQPQAAPQPQPILPAPQPTPYSSPAQYYQQGPDFQQPHTPQFASPEQFVPIPSAPSPVLPPVAVAANPPNETSNIPPATVVNL